LAKKGLEKFLLFRSPVGLWGWLRAARPGKYVKNHRERKIGPESAKLPGKNLKKPYQLLEIFR